MFMIWAFFKSTLQTFYRYHAMHVRRWICQY